MRIKLLLGPNALVAHGSSSCSKRLSHGSTSIKTIVHHPAASQTPMSRRDRKRSHISSVHI